MRSVGEEEAVAAIAAIERFLAETAPVADEGKAEQVSPWQRAALIEGVSAKGTVTDLEGDNSWLS